MSRYSGNDNPFKTEDREDLTDKERAALFLKFDGRCCECTRKIGVGEIWHDDHDIALMNGGTNKKVNRRLICAWCHKEKTKDDHAVAKKARAVRTKHLIPTSQRQKRGRPLAGTKASGWRKKVNGEVERR